MSEALLLAEHEENMLYTKKILNVGNNFCTKHVLPRFEVGIFMYWTCNSINNLSSYCGLVDAKIRASDKDLPVQHNKYETATYFSSLKPNLDMGLFVDFYVFLWIQTAWILLDLPDENLKLFCLNVQNNFRFRSGKFIQI